MGNESIKRTCEWCDHFDGTEECLEHNNAVTKEGSCESWENGDVEPCDFCGALVEVPYVCGRCGKHFCDDCGGEDSIPYRTAEDFCSQCGDEFQSLWSDFTCGNEIHMDAVPKKEKKKGS